MNNGRGGRRWFALAGLVAVVTFTLAGCETTATTPGTASGIAQKGAGPKDGELPLAGDYKTWPRFLTGIDKEQVKQVRDIYINTVGAQTMAGKDFPNGTVMVMEIYKAKESADGDLAKGADGKLIKGDLAKVFIMGKGDGWGQTVPDNLKTGAWVFSAAGPDGKPVAEDFTKCRACHVPLAQKDFVHRYDEYFEKRGRM
jgi:hemoglobin